MIQEPLHHMRTIVEAHPTITVRELAQRMGFSENRSIYYWLRKGGYKGLRDFKARVLATSADPSDVNNDDDGVREEKEGSYFQTVFTVETHEFTPWLLPGDRLILDPEQDPQDGNLVVVHHFKKDVYVRRYIQGSPILLIHPVNSRDVVRLTERSDDLTITRVVRLIRELP